VRGGSLFLRRRRIGNATSAGRRQESAIVLLTIMTADDPATEPASCCTSAQPFDVSVGRAHVFYPNITPERCPAALLLEVDPDGLVRGRRGPSGDVHRTRVVDKSVSGLCGVQTFLP
jgi:hypothetical protein